MPTIILALALLWSIFGVFRFNHDYKRPIVIAGWADLFLRYGVIMYLVCVALYLAHGLIKWRSDDARVQPPAHTSSRQSLMSLSRANNQS